MRKRIVLPFILAIGVIFQIFGVVASAQPIAIIIGEESIDNTIYPTDQPIVEDITPIMESPDEIVPDHVIKQIEEDLKRAKEIPEYRGEKVVLANGDIEYVEYVSDNENEVIKITPVLNSENPRAMLLVSLDEKLDITEFSISAVNKNCNVYAADKKKVVFTMAKGDSLMISNVDTNLKWTRVFTIGDDSFGYSYVSTKNLITNKNKEIIRKETGNIKRFCAAIDSTKSHKILKEPNSASGKLGILRKTIALPLVSFNNEYATLLTINGVGYMKTASLMYGYGE